MTDQLQNHDDEQQQQADRQAETMRTQLRKDVDSWSKARSESTADPRAEASATIAAKPPRTTAAAKSAAAKPVAKPTSTAGKPFSMSYDGVTTADYIRYRIDRGLR